MNKLRVCRDLFLIFTLAFTSMMIITILAGAAHDNKSIFFSLVLSFLYADAASIFFSESLRNKIGYLSIEIIYVLLLNVIYIVMGKLVGWNFSVRGYLINTFAIIFMYALIKIIIFSIDKVNADKINEALQRRKRGGGHN